MKMDVNSDYNFQKVLIMQSVSIKINLPIYLTDSCQS